MHRFVVSLPGNKRKLPPSAPSQSSKTSSSIAESTKSLSDAPSWLSHDNSVNKSNSNDSEKSESCATLPNVVKTFTPYKAPRKQPVQMCLDFGQRSLGKFQTCNLCKMVYIIGDSEDEARHKKFCSVQAPAKVTYPCLKSKKLVLLQNNDSIIKLTHQERFHREPIQKILQQVQADIGCGEEFLEQTSQDSLFVYLQGYDNEIAGIAIMEIVSLLNNFQF